MNDLKRQIIQNGLAKLLDEAKVPQRIHLQVIEVLNKTVHEHKKDIQTHQEQMRRHENIMIIHEQHNITHSRQIKEYQTEIERRRFEKGEKGIDGHDGKDGKDGRHGKDGITSTVQEIVSTILPQIPIPKNGEDGKDAILDEDKVIARLIEKLQKEKVIDISHIRNAQTFMKDGIKYKIEELMRGAGGSSGVTVLTATGTVDNSNVVFTFTSTPTTVVVNGSSYRTGFGVTIVGTTATLDSPVGTGGDIYGLA